MTSTAHTLVAGAIAAGIPDPTLAIALSFSSHFIMDSIPHWDFGTNWRLRPKRITAIYAIIETMFGIIISYIFFGYQTQFSLWALCVSVSLLPDWLEVPWYIWFAKQNKVAPTKNAGFLEKFTFAFYKFPNAFHSKAQLPLGLLTQVGTVIFFIYLLR